MRDYPEWHRGRKHYTLWLIEPRSEEIYKRVNAAREHLSEFLLKPYQRQPHITLFVCGFLAEIPHFDDDYSRAQLERHTELLKQSNVGPFRIEIGGLKSFASAPFLEVQDREGGIERLRTLLAADGKEIAWNTFTPHITVGLYSGTFCSKEVGQRISTFSSKPIRLTVDRVSFARYHAQKIAGALSCEDDVELRMK